MVAFSPPERYFTLKLLFHPAEDVINFLSLSLTDVFLFCVRAHFVLPCSSPAVGFVSAFLLDVRALRLCECNQSPGDFTMNAGLYHCVELVIPRPGNIEIDNYSLVSTEMDSISL